MILLKEMGEAIAARSKYNTMRRKCHPSHEKRDVCIFSIVCSFL